MRLASPEYLWFLLVIPVMAIYLVWLRSMDLPGFRFPSLKKLTDAGVKKTFDAGVMTIGALRLAAILLIVFALARPQKGLRSEEMTTKATDIILCLDTSRSMLTIDFKPENRFQVAKQVMAEFIKNRPHDRIGLVVFGEHAITQCPLTLDKSALLSIVEQLYVGIIPPDQTAIGMGLATSVNRLKDSEAKSKVIVLLTDGSNNAGVVDPITAAKTASTFDIKIYSIGAGSPGGGLIPIQDPVFGERLVQSPTDIDEDTLLKIATESKGKYFRAKSAGALKSIFGEIDALEKTDIKVTEFVDYKEMYIYLILPAILLIFIELVLSKTRFRTVP